jgi:hypothetical protein
MSAEQVTLTPTYAPAENTAETSVLSVPVVAFPSSYDYSQQWAIGLIIAGMMKKAKYARYGLVYAETFANLKEPYRQYKYRHMLKGANAWLAWFQKFEVPALQRLGRPNVNRTR